MHLSPHSLSHSRTRITTLRLTPPNSVKLRREDVDGTERMLVAVELTFDGDAWPVVATGDAWAPKANGGQL